MASMSVEAEAKFTDASANLMQSDVHDNSTIEAVLPTMYINNVMVVQHQRTTNDQLPRIWPASTVQNIASPPSTNVLGIIELIHLPPRWSNRFSDELRLISEFPKSKPILIPNGQLVAALDHFFEKLGRGPFDEAGTDD